METSAKRTGMMDPETWKAGWWIVCPQDADESQPSRYSVEIRNDGEIASARWMLAGRSDYDVFVNGMKLADAGRKIGFAYAYDVKGLLKAEQGAVNALAAEMRGPVMTRQFRATLELRFTDGRIRLYGTCAKNWRLAPGKADGLVDRTELRKDFPPAGK